MKPRRVESIYCIEEAAMIGCVCLVVVATMEIARSGRVPADAAAGRLGLGSGDNESLLRQLISQYFTDRIMADSASCRGVDQDSSTVVPKKDVNLADGVRFNRQCPVSRSGKATGRGAFDAQSAQAISAAYYFDLAARDYFLADGAIELVIEGVPCSAFIEPPQSSELIFCARLDRLRGRKHAADAGKFRRDLQEQSSRAMNAGA